MIRRILGFINEKILFFLFLGDLGLIIFSLGLSFYLRFEGNLPVSYLKDFIIIMPLFVTVKIIFNYLNGLYKFIWSYVGLPEVLKILKSSAYSFLVITIIIFFFKGIGLFGRFPRSILFIDFFICFIFVSGLRLLKRIYISFIEKSFYVKERSLVVGAGNAGSQLLRSIKTMENANYTVLGFIDDDKAKKGSTIGDVEVLGCRSDIPRLVKALDIKTVFIAIPSAHGDVIKETVQFIRNAGVTSIKIIPSIAELIDGKVRLGDIRSISAADLLGRRIIKPDFANVAEKIKDKNVLVTGAAGSIGSEICRQIIKLSPRSLIALDQNETGIFNLLSRIKEENKEIVCRGVVGDVRDAYKINNVFDTFKPNLVFHAAAYKHVPLMEEFPEEAVKTNIFGTINLLEVSEKNKIERFVLISTDKAVSPNSVMGATKRIAEMAVCDFNKKHKGVFAAVRFGNVLESRGNAYEIFSRQIQERKEITITDPDMGRYIMTIAEAVSLVLQAASLHEGSLFVMDMGQEINMVDFAKDLIRLSGFEPDKDIPIVFTGKRPGEKTHEVPLRSIEKARATKYKDIFVVDLDETPGALNLGDSLNNLRQIAEKNPSREAFVKIFKDMIPDYKG